MEQKDHPLANDDFINQFISYFDSLYINYALIANTHLSNSYETETVVFKIHADIVNQRFKFTLKEIVKYPREIPISVLLNQRNPRMIRALQVMQQMNLFKTQNRGLFIYTIFELVNPTDEKKRLFSLGQVFPLTCIYELLDKHQKELDFFKVESTIESIYTGGKFDLVEDYLLTTAGDAVNILDLNDSSKREIKDDSLVTSFATTKDRIIIAFQNQLLKTYDFDLQELKSYKVHEAPVLVMDTKSTLVATGSADSTVKCWDIEKGHCTHNFKGHGGIISALKFHQSKLILASGSDDCKVRVWDLKMKSCIAVLDSHVSVIRGLSFSDEYLFSGSRDKVFAKWDLSTFESVLTKPTFESIEALEVVQFNGALAVCTAGESGVIKLWDYETGELLQEQHKDKNNSHEVAYLLHAPGRSDFQIITATSDQNIHLFDISGPRIKRVRQIAGYNEEILDMVLTGNDSHLAVITNTEQIRLYDVDTKNCNIVYGHSDIVLAIASSFDGKLLVTGSKDNSAKLWEIDLESETQLENTASFVGHTGPVTAIAMSKQSAKFLITGSEDRTVKFWPLANLADIKAHDKDIQSIDVAPNDSIFVTAGLDKLAKMWSVEDGSLLGVFKGHKRGIWNVKFSPVDQVIATCSTDKTLKVWNIRDYSCIRTFEGHLNTVLNFSFVSTGLQLLSTGSDGLMKLWNVKDGECAGTFDNHEDRIWAVAVNKSESTVFTGSSDSTISLWRDTTVEEQEEKNKDEDARLTKEQDLNLFLKRKDFKNALILALQLDQPFKILGILKNVQSERVDEDSVLGSASVDQFFSSLSSENLEKILNYLKDWNTHSKHSRTAQLVLGLLIKNIDPQQLLEIPNSEQILESLLAYSERHLTHATQLVKENYLLDYTLERMDALI
ncbi:Transducin (beta)-like 3 [Terramyces sp. JEL0728]|nr:Transducin (beta)-like 3 [Terramyces sp. JEL0728]